MSFFIFWATQCCVLLTGDYLRLLGLHINWQTVNKAVIFPECKMSIFHIEIDISNFFCGWSLPPWTRPHTSSACLNPILLILPPSSPIFFLYYFSSSVSHRLVFPLLSLSSSVSPSPSSPPHLPPSLLTRCSSLKGKGSITVWPLCLRVNPHPGLQPRTWKVRFCAFAVFAADNPHHHSPTPAVIPLKSSFLMMINKHSVWLGRKIIPLPLFYLFFLMEYFKVYFLTNVSLSYMHIRGCLCWVQPMHGKINHLMLPSTGENWELQQHETTCLELCCNFLLVYSWCTDSQII